MSKYIKDPIGKIYNIREKTFGEKVGDFFKDVLGGVVCMFILLVIIGLIFGGDDNEANAQHHTPTIKQHVI